MFKFLTLMAIGLVISVTLAVMALNLIGGILGWALWLLMPFLAGVVVGHFTTPPWKKESR